ncbi:bacterial alpha-L-rhamnosidase-domain-containing protein [Myxozyma melibiosi]|uniref:Bacterial alpha-L-rhamnosidase-domain-containing protein n=1 Tax=Myxozyma melibiosi TaxID=54550 RepID=A0ABR1EXW0_9ASCO
MTSEDSWTLKAPWIWLPGYVDTAEQSSPGRFVLFRKTFTLPKNALSSTECLVHVSADSRYRLFVNGISVSFGPCKSYPERWYLETVDIAPYLVEGENCISARVLRYSPLKYGTSCIVRTNMPGLMVYGRVEDIDISTDPSWKCYEDRSVTILSADEWNYLLGPPFLSIYESADASKAPGNWTDARFDDSQWAHAKNQSTNVKMLPAVLPWKLHRRTIPVLPEIPRIFDGAVKVRGNTQKSEWDSLLKCGEPVKIGSGESVTVDIQSLVLTTGFLVFRCSGGKGAKVRILCSEAYEKDLGKDKFPFPVPRTKGNRADHEHGRLYGVEDFLAVGGSEVTVYEPFWFRTFRYIQLEITCADSSIEITDFSYRETHYPLDISSTVELDAEHAKLWEISLNTLRNCMHETYEDCPFYEQNQFTMDGRVNLLFTYQVSRDDRLARKTLEEFNASRRPDGLLETNAPCAYRMIVIPQYSLYWIMMVYDHMMYFGDASLVKRYAGTIDSILNHFDCLLNKQGLVGRFDEESWPFVDWVKEWSGTGDIKTVAVPPIYNKTGVATYNSLIYSVALQYAAELSDFIGRSGTAGEYRARAQALNDAVNQFCFTGGVYNDGPGTEDKSQHAQIFAVLSGAISGDEARRLVERALSDSSFAKCSYSMIFYIFRAIEKVGLYDVFYDRLLDPWREMLANNLTTWAEDNVSCRSDCHLWSAVPIYEIVAQLFGLSPTCPGYSLLRINPRMELFKSARGSFSTHKGSVEIRWDSNELHIKTSWDAEVELIVCGNKKLCTILAGNAFTLKSTDM